MKFPEFRPFTGEQVRAARAIARLEQGALAEAADLSLDTIKRIEGVHGPVQVKARVYRAIIDALRRHGVELESHGDSGFGVRFSAQSPGVEDWSALAGDEMAPPLSASPRPEPGGLGVEAAGVLPKAEFVAPSPSIAAYWDRDLRIRFCNQEYLVWGQCSMSELLGLRMIDVVGPDAFAANEVFARAALAGEPQVFERTVNTPGDRRRHTVIRYTPDFDPQGNVLGMWSVVTDLTLLKEAELRLASATAAFHTARLQAEAVATETSESFDGMIGALRAAKAESSSGHRPRGPGSGPDRDRPN